MPFTAVNPATGDTLWTLPSATPDGVDRAVSASVAAFRSWRSSTFEERARALESAAALLRERAEALARTAAVEMGKPVSQGLSEVEKCAGMLQFYAREGESFLQPHPAEVDGARAYWSYEPLGPVLAIMPWNFPFWQVFRAAAPAIMAGNTVILKHAPSVPECALACEQIFCDAGLPDGVFQNLFAEVDDVARMIGIRGVAGVTFTGSVAAGRSVAELAGRHLKPSVLELGGSDPYIILGDADVERAAEAVLAARRLNAGQSCIAPKRLIAVDGVHDAFVEELRARVAGVELGDPLDPATAMGPLARQDLRNTLHGQVQRSVEMGAELILGGQVPERSGAWYPPTLLTGVNPEMPAFREELFGPAWVVIRARDEEDAIALANDTDFGLGAAVFTRDSQRGEAIARHQVEAGSCFVNDFVRSHPALPFGGIRDSGYGRELSPMGILAFTNVKTVWVG